MADVFSPALLQRYPFVERESLLVTRPWLQWLQLLGGSLGPFMDASTAADLLDALSAGAPAATQAWQDLAHTLLGVQSRPERLARLEAAIQGLHGALLALRSQVRPVPPVPGLDALTMQALLQSNRIPGPVLIKPGTPYHVPRYRSPDGRGLEESPLLVEEAGNLTTHVTGVPSLLLVNEHTTTAGQITHEAYQPGLGAVAWTGRRATGTLAAPGRVALGSGSLNLTGAVWARNATDTADAWTNLASIRSIVESLDAQGRVGGLLQILVSAGVSAVLAEALRITQAGNLLLGLTTHGTGLAKGLVIAEGSAPSAAHPADAVQLWVANLDGVAGTATLHMRSETGVTTRIGSGILGRLVVAVNSTATVAAPYVVTAEESGKAFVANNTTERCQFTLPTAVAGLTYTFMNVPIQGMRIRAVGTGRIRLGANATAAAGALDTITVGDSLTLIAQSSTIWQAIGAVQGFTIIA